MSEVYKVRKDHDYLFVRDMNNCFLNAEQLEIMIEQLQKTLKQIRAQNVSQQRLRAGVVYTHLLKIRERIHYPFNHDYLQYSPGKRRGPGQPRFRGVYFASTPTKQGQIKIGGSADIYQRTKGLYAEYKQSPFLIHGYIEEPEFFKLESDLHNLFGNYRIHGEWFEAEPVLSIIGEVVSDG